MPDTDVWKYCTTAQIKQFLVTLRLLGNTDWSDEKYIASLYAVSRNINNHYQQTTLLKRDGTQRHLLVPDKLLKKIQKNILRNLLQDVPLSAHATAYRQGTDIVANAQAHLGQRQILKLDIVDFFGSITFMMVYRSVFPSLYFPPSVGTLLTNLCCYNDVLPQGAPTSPAISNIVMTPFDNYIGKWCQERKIVYTRYCDDMTFSGDFEANQLKNKVRAFLQEMGLSLNQHKTKLFTCHTRQLVTGIVVNEKLQVSREYRKQLRQELYFCQKFGVLSHLTQINNGLIAKQEDVESYLQSLLGKANFIVQVNPQDAYFLQAQSLIKQLIRTHRAE
ncbi:Retron-type reverse transcriptase [Pragia fontium]|uniref:reverse transcriptase family protein n=1 Tax=Pragia fontium TaxID=82985 RepID=UPI000E032C5A|nr:reverse transcriptase family protein [Pragia fontium]SUB81724.1 Retron-type reverse transcriptase [Pragia fontium]